MKYCNIWDYENAAYPFQIFVGGRGTGKTYSALAGALERKKHFIFMRRRDKELKALMDKRGAEGYNPFKKYNTNNGTNIGIYKFGEDTALIGPRTVDEKGRLVPSGEPIGHACALSTVASIRGIDVSECDDWFYDEFIKERHVPKMEGECEALLNAYETFNRNRELEGCPPMRLWLLANSNDIYNAIFVGLGIVSTVEKMIAQNKSDLYISDRKLAIHLLDPAEEFLKAKENTALAALTKGTQFYNMAFKNEFAYNDFSHIKQMSVKGMIPVAAIDTCYIWRRKGSGEYYISYTPARVPVFNSHIDSDARLFSRKFAIKLYEPYIKGKVSFESYELKEFLLDFIL